MSMHVLRRIRARNLEGVDVDLPDGFTGDRNVVAIATAIREPVILQRTLTIHGDVNRVTRPLGIEDRSTIALLLVDGSGHVLWRRAGGFTPLLAHDLEAALTEHHCE